MDVQLLNSSVYNIPSSHRVGAIVHDGAADLRLWPGPSLDRELNEHYGEGLQKALEVELKQLGVREVETCSVVRVHPGRLHCDFLAWIVTRPPEPGSSRASAPDKALLEQAVMSVLQFAAERSVEKIAFPAIGDGPEELAPEERLAIIVHTAHRYEEQCFAAGKAPVVEEVLICDASSRVLASAKRKVASLAKTAAPAKAAADEKKPKKKAATKGRTRTKKVEEPKLSPDEVAAMRPRAGTYDRTHAYTEGDWIIHPKFGVGRVELIHPDKKMDLLFEDGARKTLIHDRP